MVLPHPLVPWDLSRCPNDKSLQLPSPLSPDPPLKMGDSSPISGSWMGKKVWWIMIYQLYIFFAPVVLDIIICVFFCRIIGHPYFCGTPLGRGHCFDQDWGLHSHVAGSPREVRPLKGWFLRPKQKGSLFFLTFCWMWPFLSVLSAWEIHFVKLLVFGFCHFFWAPLGMTGQQRDDTTKTHGPGPFWSGNARMFQDWQAFHWWIWHFQVRATTWMSILSTKRNDLGIYQSTIDIATNDLGIHSSFQWNKQCMYW